MKRLLLFLGLAFALASCSLAPITIDLLPTLQENGADSGSKPITAGGAFDLKLPDASGYTMSGYEVPAVRPNQVKLEYTLALEINGDLSGDAELAFYLAASSDDLWNAANMLGDPATVDLDQTEQTLSGQLVLSSAQIDTLMSGSLTVGARISGTASGAATVSYHFERLVLKVAFF